ARALRKPRTQGNRFRRQDAGLWPPREGFSFSHGLYSRRPGKAGARSGCEFPSRTGVRADRRFTQLSLDRPGIAQLRDAYDLAQPAGAGFDTGEVDAPRRASAVFRSRGDSAVPDAANFEG